MNLLRFNTIKLLEPLEQISPFTIPQLEISDFDGDIETIAASVRAAWNMPSGPVSNLIEQLEAASCLVLMYDFGTSKIDEAVQWEQPHPPIILVNIRASGDRLRFR